MELRDNEQEPALSSHSVHQGSHSRYLRAAASQLAGLPFVFFMFEGFVVVGFFSFEGEVAFNTDTPEAEVGGSLVRSARSPE